MTFNDDRMTLFVTHCAAITRRQKARPTADHHPPSLSSQHVDTRESLACGTRRIQHHRHESILACDAFRSVHMRDIL